MKLNKPPVSQEQNLLEDYVGFLLSESQSDEFENESNKSNLKRNNSATEKEQSASIVEQIDKDKTFSDDKVEAPSENSAANKNFKNVANSDVKNKIEDNAKLDLSNDTRTPSRAETINDVKKDSNQSDSDKALSKANNVDELPKYSNPAFEEESESEQLSAWQALIDKESNQQNQERVETASKNIGNSSDQVLREDSALEHKPKKTKSAKLEPIAHSSKGKIATPDYQPEEIIQDKRLKNVERLLSRISLANLPQLKVADHSETDNAVDLNQTKMAESTAEQMAELAQSSFVARESVKARDILPETFQTLIFQVGKLPLAVPLLKLGGIVSINYEVDVTPLVGTPDWFLGLVPNDRGNLMVVDTQRYLMPEQGQSDPSEYRFLIVLDNSNWALACQSVGDAKNLTVDDVRWAQKSSRRPWFGGMVVDYMSALIEVDELINMLAKNISD